jgi:Na+-transporting methylmalonyl-CoA/oxaloacetate decarboxylase gamma subunit
MTADALYTVVLGMMLVFIILWTLILGIGFLLSLRDDLALPDEYASRPEHHSPVR